MKRFLSPKGVSWPFFGESITENGNVSHIEQLFVAARATGTTVAISPHYYYPCDHHWQFGGRLEKAMHQIGMFDRNGPVTLECFEESGADFLDAYKPYILDGKTIIASPHKVYGPESNDLALQLRKQGVSQVILAGMAALYAMRRRDPAFRRATAISPPSSISASSPTQSGPPTRP